MYENLLLLPYFQGMSKNDLTSILDKVKLEFTRHANGEKILSEGEQCNNFIIAINNKIKSETTAPDGTFRLIETHDSPYVIEPYSLFGASTLYNKNYYAAGDCNILSINKSYFFSEFTKHDIFTINLLNLVSRRAQNLNIRIWEEIPSSIKGRIVRFIALRSETLHGEKTLIIKMERLASQLCETRINISRALNEMRQQGLMDLSRKEIHIPDFKKLTDNI